MRPGWVANGSQPGRWPQGQVSGFLASGTMKLLQPAATATLKGLTASDLLKLLGVTSIYLRRSFSARKA
ncbi:MAG: hypothetical protein ACE5Q6_15650 [Dehalococcoidia bacterium]